MDEKKYYDILHNITPDHTVNHMGVVVGGVLPFQTDSQAVKYVLEKMPEASAETHSIVWDPDQARKLASQNMYELELIIQQIYDVAETYRRKAQDFTLQAESSERENRSWEVEVYRDRAKEWNWAGSGMLDAVGVIRDRLYSLLCIGNAPAREYWAERKW